MILSRWLLATAVSITLTGCSTVSEWFESNDEDPTAPVELERISETVKLRKDWSLSVGEEMFPLSVAGEFSAGGGGMMMMGRR